MTSLPSHIGPYEVLRELGRGGFGVVYEAIDDRLGRRVALKMLRPGRDACLDGLPEIEREARVLARLNHQNIATIYSLETDGDSSFFSMEMVPGETLAARLRSGPLPLNTTLSLARQITQGIEGAHASEVIHGDLKPSNIMITPGGTVKLLDFGLSRAMYGAGRGSGSHPSTSGTPGYMSPGQIRGLPTDRHTDVWSFGCVLFECLTGRRAFEGASIEEISERTLHEEPDWDLLPDDLSERLRELLVSCLSKDPDRRRDDIGEIRRDLIEEATSQRAGRHADTTRSETTTGNLPSDTASFVGRTRPLAELRELMLTNRLVTLTGTGGCGKSRLALQLVRNVADAYPDGAWLVELAPLGDPSSAPSALLRALGRPESAESPALEIAREYLRSRRSIIILDNCEHVLDQVAAMAEELLKACPGLQVVATSRRALGVTGEYRYRVPGLDLPDKDAAMPLSRLGAIESIELLMDRARRVSQHVSLRESDADAAIEISRRLDGLPLAIELAAARLHAYSLQEVAARLEDRFSLLRGGGRPRLARHESLRALLDWSHGLLSDDERLLFRRLWVFAGGFSIDACESICSEEGIHRWQVFELLEGLIEASLVEVVPSSDSKRPWSRYRLLETVREYARTRAAERGEIETIARRHGEYYQALVGQARATLRRRIASSWLTRIAPDYDNLRAALDWAAAGGTDIETASLFTAAVAACLHTHGRGCEARSYLEHLLPRTDPDARTLGRSRLLFWLATLASDRGRLEEARGHFEECLAIKREIEPGSQSIPSVLTNIGLTYKGSNLHRARECFLEAVTLYEQADSKPGLAIGLANLASVAQIRNELEDAQELAGRALALQREIGNSLGIAHMLDLLTSIAFEAGKLERAAALADEALAFYSQFGHRVGEANALEKRARVDWQLGELGRAREQFQRSLQIRREQGNRLGEETILHELGFLAIDEGDAALAHRRFRECREASADTDHRAGSAINLIGLGCLAAHLGRPRDAARIFGAADRRTSEIGLHKARHLRNREIPVREALRVTLDEAEYRDAIESGGELAFEEALAFAIRATEPDTRPRT